MDSAGGVGVAAETEVINAAFGSDVREGLNSELIALDESRSVVIRLLEYREPELKTLAEVSGEIESTIECRKVKSRLLHLEKLFLTI